MATIFNKDGSPKNVNPFYQTVDDFVASELHNRAALYSRRVRSVGSSPPKSVEWGYQKTAWATVTGGSITMGTPGSNVMSDKDGNLTLYSAERNVPNRPLLTKVEISNEGQLGSFLKATINFTIFPQLNSSGFDIGGIEDAFFIPGKEVKLKWGWSTYANNQRACTGNFTGIVYNFNWNFNTDLSVSATVQIISPSGLALSISSDLINKGDNTVTTQDNSGKALVGSSLSKVIDADLSKLSGSISLGDGQVSYYARNQTANGKLDYFVLGLPIQEAQQSDGSAEGSASNRITKTQWYVKLGAVIEFVNELLKSFDDPMKQIFSVQCFGNETQYLNDCVSAFPVDVYFPDALMGKYGQLQPFGQDGNNPLRYNMKDGLINIGEILLGTDFVKRTYEGFLTDNAANISYKNLPNLVNELVKRINQASGDMYNLTPVLFEPEQNNIGGQIKSILTIEDTNLHTKLSVTPFQFSPTIFKPIIRSVNLSSNTPSGMMQAAFAAARGNAKPDQSNVRLAINEQRDNAEYDKEYWFAKDNIDRLLYQALSSGFNDSWSEELRGFLVKVKRTANTEEAHWLHKAIFPIKFDVTIDGINGFKFGDTLSTTMIPSVYNTLYKMVFTVVKVVHSIENKDWTTTLETAARVTSIGKGVSSSGRENLSAPVPGISPLYQLNRDAAPLPSTPGSTTTAPGQTNTQGRPTFTGFGLSTPQKTAGGVGTFTPGDGSILIRK
jgi:hypothetical protein